MDQISKNDVNLNVLQRKRNKTVLKLARKPVFIILNLINAFLLILFSIYLEDSLTVKSADCDHAVSISLYLTQRRN